MKNASLLFLFLLASSPALANECVVLLHGLARVSNSMGELESKLNRSGFDAVNINYPSIRYEIDVLADDAVGRGIGQCLSNSPEKIHFVTHSLGGILVRHYLQENELDLLGKVVMLGPPNQGSEIVDGLSPVPGFGFLGPAGFVLGTEDDSILKDLGPVYFELGVIAGTTNINPIGFLFIDGPNDSIVSVESTKVEGMNAHLVLPVTHTFMMRNNEVIDHTIHYLKTGQFIPE
ncbi:MAG: alpha/beta hydrolase [Pseudomonadales bacterium]|nr:alpha/beta hydrolase [Pseudomonadales bacterium]